MSEILITAKIHVVGGKHCTNSNFHLFRLEKTKPGCNVIGNPNIPDPKNYYEVYRIKKDHWDDWKNGKPTGKKKRGYSFVEVNHGMGGFGGIQSCVRRLIMASQLGIFSFGERNFKLVFEGGAK